MNKTPSHTGSTLRLKILAIYIIFGFLAIFTTSILVSGYALDKSRTIPHPGYIKVLMLPHHSICPNILMKQSPYRKSAHSSVVSNPTRMLPSGW